MRRYSAERYLLLSVRLGRDEIATLLDEAERTGKATALWDEAKRYPGATDVRAEVTYKDGAWEVHRPSFAHGMHSNYLDDMHPVECTEDGCPCKHNRHDGQSHGLMGDLPSGCRCGHLTMRHRWRQVRETIEVCRDPGSWLPDQATVIPVPGTGKED